MAAGNYLTFILDSHSKLANIFLFFLFSYYFSYRKVKLSDYRDIPFFWLTVALLLEIYSNVNRFGADDCDCP